MKKQHTYLLDKEAQQMHTKNQLEKLETKFSRKLLF